MKEAVEIPVEEDASEIEIGIAVSVGHGVLFGVRHLSFQFDLFDGTRSPRYLVQWQFLPDFCQTMMHAIESGEKANKAEKAEAEKTA